MKNYIYILFAICVLSCNSESSNDCFQKSGNSIQEEYMVSALQHNLILEDDAEQRINVVMGLVTCGFD